MYFNLPTNNFPSGSYYILVDDGIAISDLRCKTNSVGLSDPSIWTFKIDSSTYSEKRFSIGNQ